MEKELTALLARCHRKAKRRFITIQTQGKAAVMKNLKKSRQWLHTSATRTSSSSGAGQTSTWLAEVMTNEKSALRFGYVRCYLEKWHDYPIAHHDQLQHQQQQHTMAPSATAASSPSSATTTTTPSSSTITTSPATSSPQRKTNQGDNSSSKRVNGSPNRHLKSSTHRHRNSTNFSGSSRGAGSTSTYRADKVITAAGATTVDDDGEGEDIFPDVRHRSASGTGGSLTNSSSRFGPMVIQRVLDPKFLVLSYIHNLDMLRKRIGEERFFRMFSPAINTFEEHFMCNLSQEDRKIQFVKNYALWKEEEDAAAGSARTQDSPGSNNNKEEFCLLCMRTDQVRQPLCGHYICSQCCWGFSEVERYFEEEVQKHLNIIKSIHPSHQVDDIVHMMSGGYDDDSKKKKKKKESHKDNQIKKKNKDKGKEKECSDDDSIDEDEQDENAATKEKEDEGDDEDDMMEEVLLDDDDADNNKLKRSNSQRGSANNKFGHTADVHRKLSFDTAKVLMMREKLQKQEEESMQHNLLTYQAVMARINADDLPLFCCPICRRWDMTRVQWYLQKYFAKHFSSGSFEEMLMASDDPEEDISSRIPDVSKLLCVVLAPLLRDIRNGNAVLHRYVAFSVVASSII